MGQEIRKETDWLGNERDVIYQDGERAGVTKHETTIFGIPVDRTYDNSGNRVSETRHETTLFGTSKEVTRDTHGNKVSETRYEEGFFGGKKGVIYEDGRKIGELKTEKGFFGGRKQVFHESGEDVDLTRRATRESSGGLGNTSSGVGGGGGGVSVNSRSSLGFLEIIGAGVLCLGFFFGINSLRNYKPQDRPVKHSIDHPRVQQNLEESVRDLPQFPQANNQSGGDFFNIPPLEKKPAYDKPSELEEKVEFEKFVKDVNAGDFSSYNTHDYSVPEVKLDPKVIPSFHRFVRPLDVIDLHDGSVAVQLVESFYYKVGPAELEELNSIYKKYEQTFQNALSGKNRYMSRKVIENSVRENLRTELRRAIMSCDKFEPENLAFDR